MNASYRPPRKRLMRSSHDRMLGGVCSGIAAYTGWDVTLLRILVVAAAFLGLGTAVVIYLVAWLLMPLDEPGY